MKLSKSMRRLLGILLICVAGSPLAGPRVVVSDPSLHSLVSSLMEGVAQPALLYPDARTEQDPLDPFQVSRLVTADLIVWVGPGLETGLAETAQRIPALESKLLTLSRTMPLLSRDGQPDFALPRDQTREMKFWSDPRLAIMAVRRIAPLLVHLDPEHQELYLDNEIRLVQRLKGLEPEIAALIARLGPLPKAHPASRDVYFVHRFAKEGTDSGTLYKAAADAPQACAAGYAEPHSPGADLYFERLRRMARSLAECGGGALPRAAQAPASTSVERPI